MSARLSVLLIILTAIAVWATVYFFPSLIEREEEEYYAYDDVERAYENGYDQAMYENGNVQTDPNAHYVDIVREITLTDTNDIPKAKLRFLQLQGQPSPAESFRVKNGQIEHIYTDSVTGAETNGGLAFEYWLLTPGQSAKSFIESLIQLPDSLAGTKTVCTVTEYLYEEGFVPETNERNFGIVLDSLEAVKFLPAETQIDTDYPCGPYYQYSFAQIGNVLLYDYRVMSSNTTVITPIN